MQKYKKKNRSMGDLLVVGGFFAAIVVAGALMSSVQKSKPVESIAEIENELENAVIKEDYMLAAQLRDKLKQIKSL